MSKTRNLVRASRAAEKASTTNAFTAALAKPSAVVEVVTASAAIVTKLGEAGAASASMFSLTREAAQMAAVELNPRLEVASRVAEVMARYADALKSAGHNVKAIFGDCLMLAAAGQAGVTVTVATKDASGTHKTEVGAAVAIDQPKHGLREAAKQARITLGLGRNRAPRTPTAPTTAPTSDAVAQALTAKTDTQKFEEFCEQLTEYMGDAVFHPQLQAYLLSTGWKLARATKEKAPKPPVTA